MISGKYLYIDLKNTIHIHTHTAALFKCTSRWHQISTFHRDQDLTLRLLLAQRYELGDSPLPSSQLEAADDAYRSLEKKVIHDDQLKKLMFDFSTQIFKLDFLE